MKRHPHRKTKIQVGDQVYATTEILVHEDAPPVPLGATGKVLRIDGKVLDVQFDEPGVARVARGQVRLAPSQGYLFETVNDDRVCAHCQDDQTVTAEPFPDALPGETEHLLQPFPCTLTPDASATPPPPGQTPPQFGPTITINDVKVPAMIVTTGKDVEP